MDPQGAVLILSQSLSDQPMRRKQPNMFPAELLSALETAFETSIFEYALLHALDTLLIYPDENNSQGLRYGQEKLQQYYR